MRTTACFSTFKLLGQLVLSVLLACVLLLGLAALAWA